MTLATHALMSSLPAVREVALAEGQNDCLSYGCKSGIQSESSPV